MRGSELGIGLHRFPAGHPAGNRLGSRRPSSSAAMAHRLCRWDCRCARNWPRHPPHPTDLACAGIQGEGQAFRPAMIAGEEIGDVGGVIGQRLKARHLREIGLRGTVVEQIHIDRHMRLKRRDGILPAAGQRVAMGRIPGQSAPGSSIWDNAQSLYRGILWGGGGANTYESST